MPKSKIYVTSISNIDYNNSCIIDNSKVEVFEYDSLMDVFLFENIITGDQRRGNLMDVSLFDDIIVSDDGRRLKILSMLTKG